MLLQWQMAILGTFIPELKTDNIRKVIGESLYFSVCHFVVLPYFEICPYTTGESISSKQYVQLPRMLQGAISSMTKNLAVDEAKRGVRVNG